MATRTESVAAVCAAAKHASRLLATLDTQAKNDALERIAAGLEARVGEILEANLLDLEAGRESDLSTALLDRLALDERQGARPARRDCRRLRGTAERHDRRGGAVPEVR